MKLKKIASILLVGALSISCWSGVSIDANAAGTSGPKTDDVATVLDDTGINLTLFDYNDTDIDSNINTSVAEKGLDSYIKWTGSLNETHTSGTYASDKFGEGFIHGMVANKLVNGYPMLLKDYHAQDEQAGSLGFLFGDGTNSHVTTYNTKGGLFWVTSDGYYEYYSDLHAADYDMESNQFYVRNYTETTESTAGRGLTSTSVGRHDFLPLTCTDGIVIGTNTNGNTYNAVTDDTSEDAVNYWFGLKMDASFEQPKGGKLDNGNHMVFEFTGDDDVWLFIDGVLVLDMGGTHAASSGSINFATGEIKYTSYNPDNNYGLNKDGTGGTGYDEELDIYTIKECFEEAGMYDEDAFDGNTLADYTRHRIDYFYMERGSSSSCCHIKFNIPTIPTEKVGITKKIENMNAIQVASRVYKMKLYIETEAGSNEFVEYKGVYALQSKDGTEETKFTAADGTFELKDDEMALFDVPLGRDYFVEESGTGTEFYEVIFQLGDTDAEAAKELTESGKVQSDKYEVTEDGKEDLVTVTNTLVDGSITVNKTFTVEGNEIVAPDTFEANFSLYSENDLENALETVSYSEFENGSYTFDGLLPGKYFIKEASVDEAGLIGKEYLVTIDGMLFDVVQTGPETFEYEATITAEELNTTVSIENVFDFLEQKLVIGKTVTGDTPKKRDTFKFELLLTREDIPYTFDVEGLDNLGFGKYTFELKDKETIELFLPFGYSYKISEVEIPDRYTASIIVNNEKLVSNSYEGIIETDNKVEFQNTYKEIVDTGDHANIRLWVVLMVATLGICGVIFVKRRKR